MPVFPNVAVGFPSKVTGSEAEEEWQEVDWVTWTTGDLSIDDDFLLVLKPSSGGSDVKSKPLGNLVRGSTVAQDEGRTLVVNTSDALHKVYRFTFESKKHAADFAARAKTAEDRWAAAESKAAEAARAGGASQETSESMLRLEAGVREKMRSRAPLVFGGVELYGPDPCDASSGSEVLLGRGALVLIDPAEGSSVGSYEILFFSEEEAVNPSGPAQKFVIGPKMALSALRYEEGEDGVSIDLPNSATGLPTHTLRFDSAHVAAGFSRDYTVRQRLMEMASKTVKGRRAASDLKSEIEDMKRRSFTAQFMRILSSILVLACIASVLRLAQLYAEDSSRPPAHYLGVLVGDAARLVRASRTAAMATTAKACGLAVGLGGAVPAVELEFCVGLESASQVKRCVEGLVGH